MLFVWYMISRLTEAETCPMLACCLVIIVGGGAMCGDSMHALLCSLQWPRDHLLAKERQRKTAPQMLMMHGYALYVPVCTHLYVCVHVHFLMLECLYCM